MLLQLQTTYLVRELLAYARTLDLGNCIFSRCTGRADFS